MDAIVIGEVAAYGRSYTEYPFIPLLLSETPFLTPALQIVIIPDPSLLDTKSPLTERLISVSWQNGIA